MTRKAAAAPTTKPAAIHRTLRRIATSSLFEKPGFEEKPGFCNRVLTACLGFPTSC